MRARIVGKLLLAATLLVVIMMFSRTWIDFVYQGF